MVRVALEQLEVQRADPKSDIEHARVLDSTGLQEVHHRTQPVTNALGLLGSGFATSSPCAEAGAERVIQSAVNRAAVIAHGQLVTRPATADGLCPARRTSRLEPVRASPRRPDPWLRWAPPCAHPSARVWVSGAITRMGTDAAGASPWVVARATRISDCRPRAVAVRGACTKRSWPVASGPKHAPPDLSARTLEVHGSRWASRSSTPVERCGAI